jgi:hypothetical protein
MTVWESMVNSWENFSLELMTRGSRVCTRVPDIVKEAERALGGKFKYVARTCPRCGGYLGIVLRVPGGNTPLQAINDIAWSAAIDSLRYSCEQRVSPAGHGCSSFTSVADSRFVGGVDHA